MWTRGRDHGLVDEVRVRMESVGEARELARFRTHYRQEAAAGWLGRAAPLSYGRSVSAPRRELRSKSVSPRPLIYWAKTGALCAAAASVLQPAKTPPKPG